MIVRLSIVAAILAVACPAAAQSAGPQASDPDGAPELTVAAEQAIDKGLKYLLATQNADGSWTGEKASRPIAGTCLGLMAFMVKGHFPGFGRHGDALDRAKQWLLKKAEGSPGTAMGGMYEHGLYTLALSELWGMTADVNDNRRIQVALEQAVSVILRAQNPGGGWRYQPRPDAGQDTSVTAMVFIGLASARQAGVLVPDETIERVVGYLRDQAWDQPSGGFGYMPGGGATLGCTAGGAYAAQLCGQRDTEWVQAAIRNLERNPKVFQTRGHFYYSHYYAIQAMVLAGDDHYAKWYPQVRDALIRRQAANGSWGDNESPHTTPMAIIILGTPHRYLPIYQR